MKLTYKTRGKFLITQSLLRQFEALKYGEYQIAELVGVSRMQLYRIRNIMGCKRKSRCDKGVPKKTFEEKENTRFSISFRE